MSDFTQVILERSVREIETLGATTIPAVIGPQTRRRLLDEITMYQLEVEPVEKGPHRVTQAFAAISEFPVISHFREISGQLQRWLVSELCEKHPGILSEPLTFTELVAQRYQPCPVGISAHRDGASFINLIAILVLEGQGRFCICDDREGSNPVSLRNEPGDLILMRGPGFRGSDIQPFHFVDKVETRRTTFSLRHKKLAHQKPAS